MQFRPPHCVAQASELMIRARHDQNRRPLAVERFQRCPIEMVTSITPRPERASRQTRHYFVLDMVSYLSFVLRTRCGAALQLRNLVPHRAVDNGDMLAWLRRPSDGSHEHFVPRAHPFLA